jgi:hypothetical protein
VTSVEDKAVAGINSLSLAAHHSSLVIAYRSPFVISSLSLAAHRSSLIAHHSSLLLSLITSSEWKAALRFQRR